MQELEYPRSCCETRRALINYNIIGFACPGRCCKAVNMVWNAQEVAVKEFANLSYQILIFFFLTHFLSAELYRKVSTRWQLWQRRRRQEVEWELGRVWVTNLNVQRSDATDRVTSLVITLLIAHCPVAQGLLFWLAVTCRLVAAHYHGLWFTARQSSQSAQISCSTFNLNKCPILLMGLYWLYCERWNL